MNTFLQRLQTDDKSNRNFPYLIKHNFEKFSNNKFAENPKKTRGVVPRRQTDMKNPIVVYLN